ncbi:HlyC/CorC family transporter [Biformimicrobium ophioploci]|uniref:CNNM domain-containing protein n=1 Tax=Biformimicrobium ophioploci TaxID=3036711 RepID=A0ABQ6LZI3_9GAMM|nr:HlyC/CorC family transporter [Microbulbifer sp. NKW57]GMG87519.1 CNNM domain-containing protein [Microbulbifer sp. NKW57]
MDDLSLSAQLGLLALLILISAFFSSSETGMMSLNRYRLRHKAKSGDKAALRASRLLARPDRLIGVILIGNNAVNILASVIAGAMFTKLYGDSGVWVATGVLTFVILIFAEVTPKTIAALKPESIAFPASLVLQPMLVVLSPVVRFVNTLSNALARLFGVDAAKHTGEEHLLPEELRTVVFESGALIPSRHKGMLLNILDLDQATVEDIMIPRNEVDGLDLEDSVEDLLECIRSSEYTRLPVFEGDINKVIGILHLRKANRFLSSNIESFSVESIKRYADEPYFVPEATPLPTLLKNMQQRKARMAMVVDEYGEVLGIVTLEDVLEEIVGDFTTAGEDDSSEEITEQEAGWHLIEGGTSIREINRTLNWDLPTDGPKTFNGLAIEHLENIPDANISFYLGRYLVETVQVTDKVIESARVRKIGKD